MARVECIFVAAVAGAEARSVDEADARAGTGLAGDRYAAGAGYWRDDRVSRDLTLVAGEVIDDLGATSEVPLSPGDLRRNVVTRGVALNDLVGELFWIGSVLCRGTGLCEPCRHLEEVTGKRLLRPLVHRGGLRAELLTSGTIAVGDPVEPTAELDGVGVVALRADAVLLGRRLSAHGRGTWSFPGGKPHAGESALACALRELEEETGLVADGGRVVGETFDAFPESRLVFRTRFVQVDRLRGRVRVREPEKAEGWRWSRWASLPSPLFAPVASLVRTGYDPFAGRSC